MHVYGEIFWLFAVIIFCAIEGYTFNLVCIWFAGGALAALLTSAFGGSAVWQYAVFLVVSGLLLYFTRPIVKRYFAGRKVRTNADRIIGNVGVVVKAVNPLAGTGQVKVLGQIWSARPEDGVSEFEEGQTVEVLGITGVKVLVKACGPSAQSRRAQ